MDVRLKSDDQSDSRLVFGASMTVAHANELEDQIINALRRHQKLEVDLSGVREMDGCGVHLLGMLNTLGGADIRIVATSPVVDEQYKHLLAFLRGSLPHRNRCECGRGVGAL